MAYLRDRVIILKKDPFREQDRRYVMYGREYGLLEAVARGASSVRSKQAGHMEPFSEAEVMIAKGKAFDKLAVARMTGAGSAFRAQTVGAYAIMGTFAQMVASVVRAGVGDERIFTLLHECRDMCAFLPFEPTSLRGRFLFAGATIRLLDTLGYAPSLASADLSAPVATTVRFVRRVPLVDMARVTAPASVLEEISTFVEKSFADASLTKSPIKLESLHHMMA